MADLASRFMRAFEGFYDAHGTYETEQKSALKKKVEIKATARTKREPITIELWEKHLAGETPLGVIPIRKDSTCSWGCIDVDKYENVDLPGLVQRIAKLELPLIVARSKSGGAHLFLFMKKPCAAADMRHKLEEISAVLGFGGCEIFPKQTQINYEKGDLGNWLNMPYFGGYRTTRYGFLPNGEAATPEQFLELVEQHLIGNIEKISAKNLTKPEAEFTEGPPCLELLTAEGFPEGTRNNGLFALGVFVKKKYPGQLREKLMEFNYRYMNPPLDPREVDEVIKSLDKPGKHYNYKCTEPPCLSYCNRGACLSRKYGVGQGGTNLRWESLTILESTPKVYFLDVIKDDGTTMRVDFANVSELTTQKRFADRVTEICNIYFPMMSPKDFSARMHALFDQPTIVQPAPEFTQKGEFWELMEEFCVGKSKGNNRDDVARDKVWTEDGYHWFTTRAIENFLSKKGFKYSGKGHLSSLLTDLGGMSGQQIWLPCGKNKKVWRVPEFKDEQKPFKVPDLKEPAL